MQVQCYKISDDGHLHDVACESVREGWQTQGAQYWADVTAPVAEDLRKFLEPLHLPATILVDCLGARDSSQIIPSTSAALLRIPVLADVQGDPSYVTYLSLPKLLVTIHDSPVHEYGELLTHIRSGAQIANPTSALLMSLLLALHVDASMQRTITLRADIDRMSDNMDRNAGEVELESILEVRRSIRKLFHNLFATWNQKTYRNIRTYCDIRIY